MGTVTFFEETLRGSDWGKPADRATTVSLFEFEGYVHLRMAATADETSNGTTVLFSLSEAQLFRDQLDAAIRRVSALGEI